MSVNKKVLYVVDLLYCDIFFNRCLLFFQIEMYCIFCPIREKVSRFFLYKREFYLVFKYVYIFFF